MAPGKHLLRVMAGIYEPAGGEAIIRGRISPLFDIGLGIDTDLSGYDNIILRGMIWDCQKSRRRAARGDCELHRAR